MIIIKIYSEIFVRSLSTTDIFKYFILFNKQINKYPKINFLFSNYFSD